LQLTNTTVTFFVFSPPLNTVCSLLRSQILNQNTNTFFSQIESESQHESCSLNHALPNGRTDRGIRIHNLSRIDYFLSVTVRPIFPCNT
jgi:hypothetical protein